MPDVRVVLIHQLGKAEALKRVRTLLTNIKRDHAGQISDLRETWNDNGSRFSFNTGGFNVSGELIVTDCRVTITGKLPFLAGMFKGKIEENIRNQARGLLI